MPSIQCTHSTGPVLHTYWTLSSSANCSKRLTNCVSRLSVISSWFAQCQLWLTMASVTLLFAHVVPACHSTAHRLDPLSQQVKVVFLTRHYRLAQLSTSYILPPQAQCPGNHMASHQSSRSAKPDCLTSRATCNFNFLLLSLWNRHILTILLTTQQRVDVWDFDFLWSYTLILYQHCLARSHKSKYDLTRPMSPLSSCSYYCADNSKLNEAPSVIKRCWWLACCTK
jgi:hypothetical protein